MPKMPELLQKQAKKISLGLQKDFSHKRGVGSEWKGALKRLVVFNRVF